MVLCFKIWGKCYIVHLLQLTPLIFNNFAFNKYYALDISLF